MLLGGANSARDDSLVKRAPLANNMSVVGPAAKQTAVGGTLVSNTKGVALQALAPGSGKSAQRCLTQTEQNAVKARQIAAKARQRSLEQLMTMRFRKALRSNDARQMITCVESGYKVTLIQWVNIIGKIHVATALKLVDVVRTLEPPCCATAIRRQHKKLFKAVMSKIDQVPESQIETLMSVPAYYLGVCLDKGLNPNTRLKNKRLPLEHACAHSRVAHIEILLQDARTTVSQNVCRFMIRQTKQQRFAKRAIELCNDIVPNMILEAVVANVTPALVAIMEIIEPKYEDHATWSDLTHMMMCPILNDYTTDIVKTPVNNHYYDRSCILKWVREKGTDPLTRETLRENDLLLRSEFLKEYATELQTHVKKLNT